MRSFAIALVLAALLVVQLAAMAAPLPVLVSAPLLVALGISAPLVVQRGFSWIGVTCGAASALVLGAAFSSHPSLAVFGATLLWLAPRAWTTRSARDLGIASAAGGAAAGVAAWVVPAYADAPATLHVASCVFAGAGLAMAALAGRADEPLLHSLRVAAAASEPPVRGRLEEAISIVTRRFDAEASEADRRIPLAPARRLAKLADDWIALRGLDDGASKAQRARIEERIHRAVLELSPSSPAPATASATAPAAAPPTAPASAPAPATATQPASDTAESPPDAAASCAEAAPPDAPPASTTAA